MPDIVTENEYIIFLIGGASCFVIAFAISLVKIARGK